MVDRGLSPRVRGNHSGNSETGDNRGSIPACAGEPIEAFPMWLSQLVYPRVCGGTTAHNAKEELPLGLSPRVRGNLPG